MPRQRPGQDADQTGRRPSFQIVGELKDNADLLGIAVVTQRVMSSQMGVKRGHDRPGEAGARANAEQPQNRLENFMERAFATREVLNQQELKQAQEDQVNQLLGLIYALLSLAVIISLFGIANTLLPSIHERTRELGILGQSACHGGRCGG